PVSADAWIHRCGRAGRMGASGHIYAILGPGEECVYANEAEPYTPAPMAEPWRRQVLTLWFHAGKKEKLSRGDVAGALIRVAGLAPDTIGLISAHDHRVLAAVPARDAASAAEILNSSKIKGHRIRVTLQK
ncbi:MAG: DbpA RNA binding domain-containing protein, partial [Muribaculaceae bacterium]|nr:DbpA RNA binding domain-containing protein [Muribaculaceae bacterium]